MLHLAETHAAETPAVAASDGATLPLPVYDIHRLQAEAAKLPQVELQTLHHFADGMYCRVLPRPADTTIVGKVHKREHFYICAAGRVLVVNEDGSRRELRAGDVVVSKPGTKRAVYAIEDSVCLTVHRTDSTELKEIERELIEPDSTALFDASNKIITDRIGGGV